MTLGREKRCRTRMKENRKRCNTRCRRSHSRSHYRRSGSESIWFLRVLGGYVYSQGSGGKSLCV